jgi:hypothetical protein
MRDGRLCFVGFVFLVRTLAPAACDPQKVPLHESSILMCACGLGACAGKKTATLACAIQAGHPQRLHPRR